MGVTIGDPTAGAGVDESRAVVLEDVLRTPKSPRLPIRLSGKDKGGASKGKGPLLPTHDAFDPKKAPALHVGDDCILDIPDESSTMLSPVGLGEGLVQCDLERVWGGFGRGPWMTEHIGFRLYKAGTDELILSARKRGSEYLISAYTDENHDNNYCAVLSGNFMKTDFRLYSRWCTHCEPNASPYSCQSVKALAEIGGVIYEKNLKGDCPRRISFAMPQVGPKAATFCPTCGEQGMVEKFLGGEWDEMEAFASKPPKWSEEKQRFEGGFTDRVKVASVRNYQLVSTGHGADKVILQFGKRGKKKYSLDFHHPFSPIQAFAAAITSFEAWGVCT
mmetsp:Transcript_61939/g.195770  ORF Transcript_61939/g.195770 Transcript_61939/m.195770 type:complete len:333 (+) Transcript_61939:423-1421(+)